MALLLNAGDTVSRSYSYTQPSPLHPSLPQGTGERTGNLAKYWKPAYVTSSGGVNTNRVNGVSFPVKLEAGQTVSFTNQKTNFGRGVAIFSEFDGETLTNMIYRSTNNAVTYTADSDCYVVIWGNYDNTTSMNETVFDLCGQMLNSGSTPLPYEPYGYKIPISSANTTTPVYLGEVETTRKIRKLVLTGSEDENWNTTTIGTNDYIYRMELSDLPKSGVAPICTHYTGSTASRWVDIANYEVTTSILNSVAIRHSGLTGVSDWKTYLQQQYANGTPVTAWYVLATETTGIVNEPLRKIGDYADTVSGITIPTITGKDSFDVLTTLRPSEVNLAYTGWHDATAKEWDGSEWQ